ncbi:GNAT family N-acetyltransferase [Calothrix sp. 336/3]|uniref:GNAT family N-acetyltransferase n=1 Tax=Calothrix sp. 336/3 TaxID=1337936 RepID=UPI0004E3F965|nr:GNAT family N-acetyltransferase [Calothrix sp. 336/3]AKG22969.1 acetyltransferase [Calothrix sp. 336/3]
MAISKDVQIREAYPEEDRTIAEHFYLLWLDNHVPSDLILPDSPTIIQEFIHHAREKLSYKAFIAEVEGQAIASVACQLFSGLYPLVLADTVRKYGYIWGVFVSPDYRGEGIATKLTTQAVNYLQNLGCTKAILHASPSGKPVYERLGFSPTNEMSLDLTSLE